MVATNTPPASPDDGIHEPEDATEEMEYFEDEFDEVINIEEAVEGEEAGDDDGDDEDIIEGADNVEPVQDDAAYVFTKHKGSVFCCHIDPGSGTLAVTGGEDDMAYVWDIETGEVVLSCTEHKDSVISCKFSHDGKYVATGDMSGVVQVWQVATRERVWQTTVSDLTWLKWHHGARVLVGGTVSGDVYMWKIPSGESRFFTDSGVKTECGAIMPDGKRLAVGYDNGRISVFDLKACTVLHRVESGNETLITSIDTHADNNLLIAGTTGGKALLLKTQTGKVVGSLNCDQPAGGSAESRQCVEATGFCRVSGLAIAATGTLDGYLTLWDTARLTQRHAIKQDSGITKLVWDAREPRLYSAGLDGIVRCYDGRSGDLLEQWSGCRGEILDISLAGDGKTLLVGSADSTARVFRRRDG